MALPFLVWSMYFLSTDTFSTMWFLCFTYSAQYGSSQSLLEGIQNFINTVQTQLVVGTVTLLLTIIGSFAYLLFMKKKILYTLFIKCCTFFCLHCFLHL